MLMKKPVTWRVCVLAWMVASAPALSAAQVLGDPVFAQPIPGDPAFGDPVLGNPVADPRTRPRGSSKPPADFTPATAVPAGQAATIARLRATAGPRNIKKTYRTDCGDDVNIASINGEGSRNARIDPVYIDTIQVLDLGRCEELPGAERAERAEQLKREAAERLREVQ
jgi:hypothetical protein